MSEARLCFCPGLVEALNSDEPPTSSLFENLPTNVSGNRWRVYAVVLNHSAVDEPSVYIGLEHTYIMMLKGVSKSMATLVTISDLNLKSHLCPTR